MINDLYSLFVPVFIELAMLGIIIQSERSLYFIINKVFVKKRISQIMLVISNFVLIGMTAMWLHIIK